MADPWELICYHTYTGIPGVVVDLSPGRGSHGTAISLDDGDYLTDGATQGSGAIRFFKPGARVRIPPSKSWQPLSAVYGEVIVLCEPHPASSPQISMLIDSQSLQFQIRGGALDAWFSAAPHQYAEINTHSSLVVPQFQVPIGRWITLGFLHDGCGLMELSMDGQVVARKTTPLWPVNPPGAVTLGSSSAGDLVSYTQIDDVKIWRRNPRHMSEEFLNRPMDDQAADCWARFGRELREALRRHPDCGRELVEAARNAINSLMRDAMSKGPETRERLRRTAAAYQALWSSGQLDSAEMTQLLTELVTWLELAGVPMHSNDGAQVIIDSECLRLLLSELSSLDCDPQFSRMLHSLAQVVQRASASETRSSAKGE